MNKNFFALIESRTAGHGDKICLNCDNGLQISYAQLLELTATISRYIRMQGVEPGERLVVQVPKSSFAVALYLACLRCGVIYIPLNTSYTPAEVSYFLGDATPKIFVCDPANVDSLTEVAKEHGADIITLGGNDDGSLPDSVAGLTADNEITQMSDDDIAVILYTSGTTGRSKGAMLTHKNLGSNALHLIDIWGFTEQDILLHALPIYHVHGLFVALHCALLSTATMHFLSGFDADKVIKYLPESTVLMGVPTFYTRLLKHPGFTQEVCQSVRLFVSGSAPLLADTFKDFEQRTGHRILERYGMTETGMLVSNPLDGERVAGTVGFPLPEVETRIVDDQRNEVAAGEVGILEVRGPNVFSGYWQMPEKTAEEIREDGFFITGDQASRDENGRITLVGRNKDMIISGGLNIYPIEIEVCINEMADVTESAVIGVPHEDFGEGVVAVVVADQQEDITEEGIMEGLSDKLARFKQPKKIVFVDSLPRNTMGKVQKNVLREQYKELLKVL
ncbi:MAG: AMP-binding protein [Gammaproteobacteria bacterium]|nr:AMP-binding protein [Gammaproteobacteria bacterium]